MPQPCVLTFNPGHVSLANDLVAFWNETGIHFPTVCDIEVALPGFYQSPQRAKRFGATVP